MEILNLDRNIIKWSGFFDNTPQAQAHLDEKLASISKTKLIVSAKKVLVNRRCHGLFLYRFTVYTAPKQLPE